MPLNFLRIPKLKVGALPAPYVSSVNGAAKPDPRRLLNQSERWLSSQPRHVESQILLREAQIKVCNVRRNLAAPACDEDYPNLCLTQDSWFRLGTTLHP